jgi:hypothetical protein
VGTAQLRHPVILAMELALAGEQLAERSGGTKTREVGGAQVGLSVTGSVTMVSLVAVAVRILGVGRALWFFRVGRHCRVSAASLRRMP